MECNHLFKDGICQNDNCGYVSPEEEYVFVTINKKQLGICTTVTTEKAAVTIDDAIKFLQKYKEGQTNSMI